MICTTMFLNGVTADKFLAQWRSFSIITIALLLSTSMGCATVVKGTNQKIPISSYPSDAEVYIDGNFAGSTPIDVQMKRKRDHLVTIEKTGYLGASVPVVKDVGGAVWGNIILGGLVGWGVDAITGAQYNLNPRTVTVPAGNLRSCSTVAIVPTR